jgi:hypothetical protein
MQDGGNAPSAAEASRGDPVDECSDIFSVKLASDQRTRQGRPLRLTEVTLVFTGGQAFVQFPVDVLRCHLPH